MTREDAILKKTHETQDNFSGTKNKTEWPSNAVLNARDMQQKQTNKL